MSTEDLSAKSYDAERAAFYDAYDAYTHSVGFKPAPLDIWLIARGLLDTNGRHRASSAAAVPAGWKLVPVEPTREMLKAVDDEAEDKYLARGRAVSAWKSMLAATPAPPQAVPATDAERAVGAGSREPLTDAEIDALPWGPHEGNPVTFAEGLRDFARAIERAHGIAARGKA